MSSLRESWDFATVSAKGELEIRHQVGGAKIAEARLRVGERCRASCADWCLGIRWWAFGSLEEFRWREVEAMEGRRERERAQTMKGLLTGEVPDDLTLISDKETAEVEVG